MSDRKVVSLFGEHSLPESGTFSNIITKPKSGEEMMKELRDTMARIRRMDIRLASTEPRFIVPPDWETRWPPDVVAEIKRQLKEVT